MTNPHRSGRGSSASIAVAYALRRPSSGSSRTSAAISIAGGCHVDYDSSYSHYDAWSRRLRRGEVDIAWNTPLAHAQYHRKAGNASQALVMRDVDRNVCSVLVVRADASIRTPEDLAGKTLVFGSRQAAEATVLPVYFLQASRGELRPDQAPQPRRQCRPAESNPCSSEVHVLAAVKEGKGQAGIICERFWKHLSEHEPDRVGGLKVIWLSTRPE